MKLSTFICLCVLLGFSLKGFSQKYERYMLKANRKSMRLFFSNFKKADCYYTKAIALDSSRYEAHYRRGQIRQLTMRHCFPELARQDLQKAKEIINRQLSIHPTDSLYWRRGHVEINLGNFQNACEDFDRAGELGKHSYRYYCLEQ